VRQARQRGEAGSNRVARRKAPQPRSNCRDSRLAMAVATPVSARWPTSAATAPHAARPRLRCMGSEEMSAGVVRLNYARA
jgi:hypothetical protein